MQVSLSVLHFLIASENNFEVQLSQFLCPTCATSWPAEGFYFIPVTESSAVGHDGESTLTKK